MGAIVSYEGQIVFIIISSSFVLNSPSYLHHVLVSERRGASANTFIIDLEDKDEETNEGKEESSAGRDREAKIKKLHSSLCTFNFSSSRHI